jgi:hypothetical protein
MVGDFFSKSDNYFSIGTGEGLGDDCSGGLLFLAFDCGEGLLSLGTFSNSIKVFSLTLVVGSFGSSIPDPIPLIGDRCMEGDGRGWSWWGGRASSFGVGFGWFVGVGVSGLWAHFAGFSSKLYNLLLKLGDPVGAGVLGGSECSLHAVKAGENLVHDVIVMLAEHCGAESVLRESGVRSRALARSRGAGREFNLLGVLLGTGGARTRGKDSLLGGRRS